ncbi:zinc finger translocation-associated protein isoform X2 [Latimeria chalumnae]|nr:PREDICTED: uncharacterized protein C11orf95 homolog isoform X2 [Latimeria chalumnae]XP_014354307.1 PREDICTED: uncharacterized protein C11orf95 homolog isoform X2 [Latimeria chalumnae]|eukprot:XP_005988855.1 PREDICTED: uncharacterized protein C11orf95 homolog isoform X2 [Latimeria chalumnae]
MKTEDGALVPPGKKHRDVAEERASRPGKSRIPGKDHRRYYHSVWRTEYLMDFDPRRHGMICMVCGSSLATLKLSTIKRHIWQRHPDSLYWSEEEKEVIRTSWEAHLSVEAQFGPFKLDEDVPECVQYGKGYYNGVPYKRKWCSESALLPKQVYKVVDMKWRSDQQLNGSLQNWFKWEFLMDYDSRNNLLICIMCRNSLPTLNLDEIKQHIMEMHPDLLSYTTEDKRRILECWNKWFSPVIHHVSTAADTDTPAPQSYDSKTDEKQSTAATVCSTAKAIKMEPNTEWTETPQYVASYPEAYGSYNCPQETQLETEVASSTPEGNSVKTIKTEVNTESTEAPQYAASYPEVYGSYNCPQETQLKTEVAGSTLEGNGNMKGGAVWCLSPRRGRVPGKDHRRYYQERWRMDYLMEYDCVKHGLLCMVCGSALATLKVSTIKRHIQQKHPNSSFLSPAIKEMIVEEWSKKASQLGLVVGPLQGSEGPESLQVKPEVAVALDVPTAGLPENGILVIKEELTGQGKRQRGHYPGKEQRRNYQVRWRSEYLMDYDCQRHGLICMVCGGALATLKVSTIKRHILQVHPHSLELSPEEKQKILEFYNQNALHLVHTDECFKGAEQNKRPLCNMADLKAKEEEEEEEVHPSPPFEEILEVKRTWNVGVQIHIGNVQGTEPSDTGLVLTAGGGESALPKAMQPQ